MTKRNYYTIWKLFSNFFIRLDEKPDNWADRLTLFVGHLVAQKKQSSTVRSYVLAIKAILKENEMVLDENQYLISSLTRACKLQNDQIKTRLPLRKGMLCMILEQVNKQYLKDNQPYLACLFTTLFSTMYHGLLRVSEVVSGEHPILARDIHIGQNKKKFLLILRTSKTHWKNAKPQMIKISATPCPKRALHTADTRVKLPCPYKLLRVYSATRGGFASDDEPLFIHADHSPVTPQQVSACLKRAIKDVGFDESLYSESQP